MRDQLPSQTARIAAAYRAIHQTRESGGIFKDPLARRILDDETIAALDRLAADESLRPMRLFIAARSRFSEDAIAHGVQGGLRQIVILGAGLDTFSLRNPYDDQGVRVFEVDFPATQAWKRDRIRAAGLTEPPSLVFAPVDFEQESLSDGLTRAGFDADAPAFFQWLGVMPYLTKQAVSSTLRFMSQSPDAVLVFDYAEPFQNYPVERRATIMATAERAAERGEPWLSLFDPPELHDLLRTHGFGSIEDLGGPQIAERLYQRWGRDIAPGPGPHIVRAQKARRSGLSRSDPGSSHF